MELNQFRDVDLVIDKANDNFIQRQFVSQGDYKGRTMTVQVTDNGIIGQVPGLTLNLRWRNQASGAADLSAYECIDAENSLFRIEYPVHMMTPGKVVANIQVIQNGQVTHLKTFEMTVQTLAGEMTGIVDKAEYGALVAVLADANKFRTDIDTLETKKADKIDLAQTNENIENLESTKADKTALAETDAEVAELDSSKADKTALANTNQQVSGLASNKVDKGGASQVTMPMLSQDVKTAMTGGSVAVVGKDAVGTTNVVDNAITLAKIDKGIVPVSYTVRSGKIPSLEVKADGFDVLTLSRDDTDLIEWGNNYYWIPLNTKVTASTALGTVSTVSLLFQTLDNTFRLVSYLTPTVAGEIFITTLSRMDASAGLPGGNGFNYELNNVVETKTFLPLCEWQASGSSNPYSVNYDTKKIKFNEDIDFYLGHRLVSVGIAKNQELDITDVLDTSKSSLWYLLINWQTKETKIIEYTQSYLYRNGDWWQVTPIRRKSTTFIIFERDVTKNNIYSKGSMRFINGLNGRFVVNKSNATLVYRSERFDFTAMTDAGHVGNALLDGDVIKLPLTSEISTSALIMFYDRLKNNFEFMTFNTSPSTIDASRYVYFGSVRRVTDANGQLTMFTADLPIPWEYEGKLYGMYSGTDDGQSYPSIAIDAPVRCIHHRGYSLRYPENTLKAYRESKKIGVNEVEMDLSWTVDNIPVNLHDETINRTARDSEGNPPSTDMKISEITLAQAREYEYGSWKSPEFKGEQIPTFEDCVIQCKALNQQLHLDRAFQLTQEKFDIVAEILKNHKFNDVVWFIDRAETCEMIRTVFPTAKLAFLIFGDVNQNAIDVCKQFNSDEAECVINSQATLTTDANVALALSEGVPVTVWSADSVDRKHLIEIGVTGISTDSINIQQEMLV